MLKKQRLTAKGLAEGLKKQKVPIINHVVVAAQAPLGVGAGLQVRLLLQQRKVQRHNASEKKRRVHSLGRDGRLLLLLLLLP